MRFVYLDESGTGKRDPHTVVAGCIVHADEQVVTLEDRLEALVERHIPKEDQDGFVLHASDILGENGYFKGRGWPYERRAAILTDLAAMPRELEIPVVYGSAEKATIPFDETMTPHQRVLGAHLKAFINCLLDTEVYMRLVWPSEIAQVVAEDHQAARPILREAYQSLRGNRAEIHKAANNPYIPLESVRGAVHFVQKDESRPMQLADACAYIIRGFLTGNPRCTPFYISLREWMMHTPAKDTFGMAPIPMWPYGPLYRMGD